MNILAVDRDTDTQCGMWSEPRRAGAGTAGITHPYLIAKEKDPAESALADLHAHAARVADVASTLRALHLARVGVRRGPCEPVDVPMGARVYRAAHVLPLNYNINCDAHGAGLTTAASRLVEGPYYVPSATDLLFQRVWFDGECLSIFDDKPLATGIGWPTVIEHIVEAAHRHGFPNSVLRDARTAANVLASSVFLLPEMSDGSEGDITFYWRANNIRASLSFEQDGSVVGYAHRTGAGRAWSLDEPSFDAAQLDPLIDFFAAN